MALALTGLETLLSGVLPMEWEPTEIHIEEMEWEYSYEGSEPMDWEDSSEVRDSKKKKVSDIIDIEVNTNFQVETILPALKKVSPPLEPNINVSLQEKENSPTAKKVSPPLTEIVLRKVRSKPKVSTPEVSFENRVILKARRPLRKD
ncbi:hypothetical protein TNIN_215691 [Trichonephila inaurata madagascariensis]|uniref:Uncharacterized protein n=1 Tax=Trichonephila inaurata madagascariensis TaxID=2747483 RepID=A0A8X6IT56_9ARAC|nr:hypothetical protein TNIN_215691 [Trichonephila inaurata madagascariensis]